MLSGLRKVGVRCCLIKSLFQLFFFTEEFYAEVKFVRLVAIITLCFKL